MAKTVEIRRHFPNDGDVLTAAGVRAAVRAGSRLSGPYRLAISSGAQRTTQSVACLLAGLGQPVGLGVMVDPGLRSQNESRWIELVTQAAGGESLDVLRELDPEFVAAEAAVLSGALTRALDRLRDGEAALLVGHSPTSEAAVLGLTGQIVAPLAKGTGVRVVVDDGTFSLALVD